MKDVQMLALEKAVRLLDSLKVDYAIIVSDELSIIKGEIELVSKKKKTRSATAPHGTYSNLFKECGINQMAVGDVVVVPCGELDPAVVKRSASAHCCNQWGSQSSISSINVTTSTIVGWTK
jgi:hypothetical protein